MKVALVLYRFSETAGGVERYVHDLAHGLVERGHEVHAFCHRRPADAPPGILFHPVPAIEFYGPLRTLSFARNTERTLERIRDTFDVVHGFGRTWLQDLYRVGGGCHREYMEQTYPSMKHPLLRPLKLLDPRHRAILHVEGKIFREHRYRRLTCISRQVRSELTRHYGIGDSGVTVIYNGFDPAKFHPDNRERWRAEVRGEWGIPENAFTALFVGSGFARKGLAQAIAATAALPREADARLVVIGKGRSRPHEEAARALGLEGRAIFLGPRPDLPRQYAAADALLFPTLYEPFGTVVLEAMATALPVVTSRIAGASEVIHDGVDSFVVEDPRDTAALAARLTDLLDRERRERMGEAAARTAAAYTIDANIDATLRIYAELVAEKARGGREAGA